VVAVSERAAVDRSGIYSWFDNRVANRVFRRKGGKVTWRAEKLTIDDSYERHYGFLNVLVRLRHTESGRTQVVTEGQLLYDFSEVEEA
jgi:hypothetical protein